MRRAIHDTIAWFRRRFLPRIEALFVEVLVMAWEIGFLKLGTIGLDRTEIHADASRHSALSWDHANRIEAGSRTRLTSHNLYYGTCFGATIGPVFRLDAAGRAHRRLRTADAWIDAFGRRQLGAVPSIPSTSFQ